jgi:hypothetical protein
MLARVEPFPLAVGCFVAIVEFTIVKVRIEFTRLLFVRVSPILGKLSRLGAMLGFRGLPLCTRRFLFGDRRFLRGIEAVALGLLPVFRRDQALILTPLRDLPAARYVDGREDYQNAKSDQDDHCCTHY